MAETADQCDMVVRVRSVAWSGALLFLLIPFQNCSQQKMTASRSTVASSAQCKAIFKAEAIAGTLPGVFNCDNFNNFKCERRIFSPDVETMSHSLKECLPSGDFCVDVEVRQFSTSGPREANEDPSLFLPGASYNREEVRCHHRFFYEGVAVFEGEGETLEEALAQAINACELGGEPL